MREYVGLLQKSDKGNSSYFFILQFDLPLSQEQATLLLEGPIVLFNIDEINMPELVLIGTDSPDGILHDHLPVDFVHNHFPGVGDGLLVGQTLLSKQIIVHPILVVFVVVVEMLAQLVQQEDKLLLCYGALEDDVRQRSRRLHHRFLLSRHQKEFVKVGKGRAVAHQAAVDHKLHVFAEAHGVRLGFGEVGPLLVEAGLVVLLEDNRIVLRLRHLNLYNFSQSLP